MLARKRVCVHLRPAVLEQVLDVARLPAADLERLRTARVEVAAVRRRHGVRHLAAREVARDRFAGSGSGMARSSDWVYGCRGFA